jgi:FAD:protein FMN transferase
VKRFRAMGCEIVVQGGDVADVFARWDEMFSRFRADSELSRVNADPRRIVHVSPAFASVLCVALDAAADTAGLVDPTLGGALLAAGYDRDFAELTDDPRPPGRPVPSRLAELELLGLLLLRPPGLLLDLNAVVKALAVDEAAASLGGGGFVSAGGDLAVREPTDVGLPGGGAVRVVSGGIATSGSATRCWRRGGRSMHHLIDPRTGAPAESPWSHVTVAGSTCLAADVAAKAAFLLGHEGPDWLDERGLPGRFVADDGAIVATRAWEESVLCT